MRNKLLKIRKSIENGNITILILGLGSVGNYLLSYLLDTKRNDLHIVVAGRNYAKMESDVNIAKISSVIRGNCQSRLSIEANVDLNNVNDIAECINKYQPDFIVNASRVYSGLKYGSISWNTLRAYGIWTPLAMKYIRNIMAACEQCDNQSIIINTSYSDATIPWLKSAGKIYPDFGSGNLNHLVPRIKFAVAQLMEISDYWNIQVILATAHFHDVVISKEGHSEGVKQLLKILYEGKELLIDQNLIWSKCKIPMPTDTKRNMMNASSNFDIIMQILDALSNEKKNIFHSPGAFGEIGGYPVEVCGIIGNEYAKICEDFFPIDDMQNANRASIYLDGVADIHDGCLIYTDELLEKVKHTFKARLPKVIGYEEIDTVAEYIISKIITPQLNQTK